MTKKIIVFALFFVLALSFAPVNKVKAISEEGIRDICRQEIAKDRESEPAIVSSNPNDTTTLSGRITNLEGKVSLMEQLTNLIYQLLVQVIDMLSKLVK